VAWTADPPTLFVADAETGQTIWSISDDAFVTFAASLDADGSRVAAIVGDTQLRLWDVATGRLVAEVTASEAVDMEGTFFNSRPLFSPDGEYVDVATIRAVVRLSASDLQPVSVAASENVLQGDIDHVPGTDHVVAAGTGGQIGRWDMSTGELVASGQSSDSSSVYNAVVSADGSLVVSNHPFSRRLVVFDAETLRPIGEPFAVGDLLFTPHFTPDGLIGNGLFNDITGWDMDPDSWQRAACLAAGRNLTDEEWAQYIGAGEPYRETCPAGS
jgi:WD40 repeat protein